MELNGEVVIGAPRERVWQALNDAAVLQACIPGCEEVVDESPTERRARVMVKVGPVRARFSGRVSLSEVEPPLRCVMGFEGSGGAAGMASGRSQVELHEDAAGTRLAYTVKASVAGKLGQIGGRLMDASAKQLADQFFAALQARLAPPATPDPEAAASPATEAAGAAPAQAAASAATAATAAPPAAAAHHAHPAPSTARPPVAAPAASGEFSRVLWFALGAAATAFGTWLGARLF
ncbi:CoxG family protein [Ramlibacter sp. MAHUQ-53]|uniref:CoxG family protein n=1 Tax=unclassified Ramlibacter TaxID=2617605 RepID=UPI00362EB7E3